MTSKKKTPRKLALEREVRLGVKTCSTCKQEKRWSKFTPQKDGRHGLTGSCRDCRAARGREKHVPVKNPPSVHEHTCGFCQKTFTSNHKRSGYCSPSCRTKHAYYRDRLATLERVRAWEQTNRDHHLVRVATKSNKRRRGVVGVFTGSDWRRLIRRHEGRCAYCQAPTEFPTIDHVVPISRGGTNFIGNILPACLDCNLSKNNSTITEWRRRLRMVAALKTGESDARTVA